MGSPHLREDAGVRARLHEWLHRKAVLGRRIRSLIGGLDRMIPAGDSVLDVGCGNGAIGAALAGSGSRVVVGAETRSRASCEIPSVVFDGFALPAATDSVDWVLFVDVLHHAVDAERIVEDARRVARRGVVIKDHYGNTTRARKVLAFMDWVGNRHLDVDLQDNYLSRRQWDVLWAGSGLTVDELTEDLDLYPWPVKPLFERGLHFMARLTIS